VSNLTAFVVLVVAALLEVGGDAVVRSGLFAPGFARKVSLVLLGGLLLTVYGVVVNTPKWDFGRLLGVYVVLFFVTAQIINFVGFHVRPGPPVLLGGALIVAGGLVMTLWS
jgi:hypothetical protein